jgi:thiol-disulfide isomerase/thioredoxin
MRGPARAVAVALALAALPAASVATEPFETLRLTRLSGGEPAAEFSVPTPDGLPLSLGALRGKVVVLNFWATWCEPCLDEMPSMQRLQQRMAGQPFTILAVNYGEAPARIEPFLGRVGVGFPVLLDQGQQMARAWRVRILPASFLVGRDGQARYHVIGEIDWTSAEAVAAVQRLLAPAGAGTPGRR